jgi:hypothetical protein
VYRTWFSGRQLGAITPPLGPLVDSRTRRAELSSAVPPSATELQTFGATTNRFLPITGSHLGCRKRHAVQEEAGRSFSGPGVVGILKSISASRTFHEFPWLRRQFWSGELWEDGYAVRTVGDRVTADLIRRYIKRHTEEQATNQVT